jgi:lysophospholipase L1-like esterase
MSKITSVLIAVVVFGAMALAVPRAAVAAPTPTHVACVGDSITAGLFASSPAASYPSVMQNLFGSSVQVQNFGHSGATMMTVADQPYQNTAEYTSATTFVAGAGASAVVDVVIMLGTNDSKSYNWMVGTGTRAQQFVTDCGALVDHFASLSTHPHVYLALPSRSFDNTYGISGAIIHDQMLPLIRQVAAAKGVPVIDVDTPTAPHPELFPDGVHPNDTGYALIAQVIHDGLLNASPPPLPDAGAAGQGGASGAGGARADASADAPRVDASADAPRAAGGASGAGGQGAGGSIGGTGGAGSGAGGSVAGMGGSGAGGVGLARTNSTGCSCTLASDGRASAGAGLLLVTVAFLALRARSRRRF